MLAQESDSDTKPSCCQWDGGARKKGLTLAFAWPLLLRGPFPYLLWGVWERGESPWPRRPALCTQAACLRCDRDWLGGTGLAGLYLQLLRCEPKRPALNKSMNT